MIEGLANGRRLDRWLAIDREGTVTVFTGKVEIGQGVHTALAQIVAEELDVAFERVRVAPVDTSVSPDEGWTAGSNSIQVGGAALRHVAAEARRALLESASSRLGAPVSALSVTDGVVRAPSGSAIPYGDLVSGELLARETTGAVPLTEPGRRRLIGRPLPRLDLPAKLAGAPAFVHDLELPDMLHARVLRPPSYGASLRALDEGEVGSMPGVVKIVRDGSFVGVIAEREELAIRALRRAERLAVWSERETLPSAADPRFLLNEDAETLVVRERHDDDGRAEGGRRLASEYSRPYIAHAAIGPSCAVAAWELGLVTVWTHSQGVHPLLRELAKVLGLEEKDVRVVHAEGAGCYGHNGADDVALDAALLAREIPGRPVRVQWTREDEFAWEPFGPAMVVRLAAELDANGDVTRWDHELWGNGHGNRPSMTSGPNVATLLAARHLSRAFVPPAPPRPRSDTIGGNRNAPPLYDFPHQRVVNHHVPLERLRVSALRSLGAHTNVFAIESFIDEIAALGGNDPIELRLRWLRDPRARAVIEAVATIAGWRIGERGDGTQGRGIGFARYKNAACYVAVVTEVRLAQDILVTRAWAAVDAGMAVNPDGVVNQIEGGIVQAVSWALKERVTFDRTRITSRDWTGYPILRFSEVPNVEVRLIDRPEEPSLGVGEGCAGPTAAAIGNAIYNATGLRLRDLPLTRERLIAAAEPATPERARSSIGAGSVGPKRATDRRGHTPARAAPSGGRAGVRPRYALTSSGCDTSSDADPSMRVSPTSRT